MDDGSEGTSWLGNIVQKFQDLFSEADVAVRQELTAVSNQLQTGMQYCRDLVEEEHFLPSDSTEKVPASEIDIRDTHSSKHFLASDSTEKEPASEIDIRDSGSSKHFLPSDSREKEPASEIDIRASDSSNIPTDHDHREKESCDEYHLPRISSTGVHAKSGVIDNENLVEEKHFQPETSVLVFPKEEEANNLEEDKLLQHDISDVVSLNDEESNNTEDASSYILSPVPSYSDNSTESCESLVLDVEVIPAEPSTASPDDTIAEDISHNEDRSVLQCQRLEKNFQDPLCSRLVEKDSEFEKYINEYLEAMAIALPISRRQQAHITYLRQVQPHYSMMKTITQNLLGIVQEQENLRASMTTTQEQEFCDSDWVIV